MIKIDVPLLENGLRFVTDNPEEHDQAVYGVHVSCGTKGCIAYHLAILAGHTIDMGDPSYTTTGEHVADVAERETGLSEDQAVQLFAGRNTIDELVASRGEVHEWRDHSIISAVKRYSVLCVFTGCPGRSPRSGSV